MAYIDPPFVSGLVLVHTKLSGIYWQQVTRSGRLLQAVRGWAGDALFWCHAMR